MWRNGLQFVKQKRLEFMHLFKTIVKLCNYYSWGQNESYVYVRQDLGVNILLGKWEKMKSTYSRPLSITYCQRNPGFFFVRTYILYLVIRNHRQCFFFVNNSTSLACWQVLCIEERFFLQFTNMRTRYIINFAPIYSKHIGTYLRRVYHWLLFVFIFVSLMSFRMNMEQFQYDDIIKSSFDIETISLSLSLSPHTTEGANHNETQFLLRIIPKEIHSNWQLDKCYLHIHREYTLRLDDSKGLVKKTKITFFGNLLF